MDPHKHQSGVMLLEVLIALLIFAVGVLGLVGMQAVAIKLTAESKYRAEAASYAEQLLSQMWADDIANLRTYYDSEEGGEKYTAWKTDIQAAGGLPGTSLSGNAPSVVIDPATNQVTITIRWQAPDAQAAHRYVTVARLNP